MEMKTLSLGPQGQGQTSGEAPPGTRPSKRQQRTLTQVDTPP